jgi:hypothetical protein
MAKGQHGARTPDLEVVATVGVLGLAAVGLVGALLGRLARPAVRLDLAHLAGTVLGVARWVAVAIVVLGLGMLALRIVCTLRTLYTRVAYAVLPPANFEPRPEAIEVFGQQLLGARRRVLAWLDRPACSIRIRLTTTAAGRVLYVVELPARFRGSLFNAFASAYRTVDVRPWEEVERSEAAEARVALPSAGAEGHDA